MGKSFFERLTSTLNLENDAENISLKTPKMKKQREKETEEPIEKDYLVKEDPEIKMPEPEIANIPASQAKNDDWLEETEGQLIVDVYQTPNEIVIKSLIAGVKPEDLDITVTNDMITVKGRREKDEVIKSEDYYYQECYWGSFSRSIILPVDVDADSAEASIKNGILTVRLPKIEKAKTKKIKVRG